MRAYALLFLLALIPSVLAEDMLTLLQNQPNATASEMYSRLNGYAAETAKAAYSANTNLLKQTPKYEMTLSTDPDANKANLARDVAAIVVALAVLAIAFYGMKYMFAAAGAVERNKAKAELQNMVILLVLALAAGEIYNTVMGVEDDITDTLVDQMSGNSMDAAKPLLLINDDSGANLGKNPIVTTIYALSLMFSALSLAVRWLFLDISRTLFPLFLALAFMPLDILKSMGRLLLKAMAVFMVVPFLDAVLIGSIVSLVGVLQLSSEPMTGILALSCMFVMMGILNLVVPYMAIQSSGLSQNNFMSLFAQVRGRV